MMHIYAYMIMNYVRVTMTSRMSRMKALAQFVYHKFIASLFILPITAPVFSNIMISTLQMRKKFQKFLDSIIAKSGKCRCLIRDIREEFSSIFINPLIITCMPMHDWKHLQNTPHHAHPPGKQSNWSLCWSNWTQSTMLAARSWPKGSSTDSLLSFQIKLSFESILHGIDPLWFLQAFLSWVEWRSNLYSSCTHLFLHEVCWRMLGGHEHCDLCAGDSFKITNRSVHIIEYMDQTYIP